MSEMHLRVGRKQTGLVLRPDAEFPNLWRIHYQGRVSDMVNLTRAKDAAYGWIGDDKARRDAKWKAA